jgi:hypothetical protein
MVHLADPVSGGHGQSIQERSCHGHILASPGKSQMWHTHIIDGGGGSSDSSSRFGKVIGGGSLRLRHGLASV